MYVTGKATASQCFTPHETAMGSFRTSFFTYFPISSFVFFVILNSRSTECDRQARQVEIWADQLGEELWNLGNIITKSDEIAKRYTILKAEVERKDPQGILSQIVGDISRMMDRKMDAINCILRVAESVSWNYEYNENYTDFPYYNSKYSPIGNETVSDIPESISENMANYMPMYLNNDTHFYNVPVNTSYSSVHVPTNVYDQHSDPQMTIQWSEALDEVFTQNYKSDPALSWQYFGSSTGVMRHYPAMRWKQEEVDKFDCRIRTWFIEATTCTKDIVILLDNSGSMQGMRKHIASFTVYSILDTFSNNDFVNVMNYSTHVNYTVPCFKDKLVQATKENIQTFKHAVRTLDPDNKSDVEVALIHAFDLLKRTREEKGCNETDDSDCNQAIMLVTDGIKGNLSNVFEKYNWFNNATNIPVRIFTYLIGAEVTKVNEIMWAACRNRGYYTHVQSLEQVAEDVFKYVPVIARPLVLQREHPTSWTHAYADLTYDDEADNVFNEPYRLLTSVAVPAFDMRANENNETVVADILGVAATDVPLDDIIKLTLPYKLGVMAYSFIVTNNGYVLFHPDLRPVFNKKILKENFNSVDLVEVEQLDDDSEPRQVGEVLLELRLALVNGEEGAMHDVPIKYHYDDNRRVTRQIYDYYYAPIKNTPFTMALVLPDTYGNYSIRVGNLIGDLKNQGYHLSGFFQDSNWKIHPKWVYCKYHYLEGHEFETPESELAHFIQMIDNGKFEWHKQYEQDNDTKNEFEEVKCGRVTLGDDDYFCNRELVQRLVFDAVNTYTAYEEPWKFTNDREKAAFMRYNASLRFVATMSGLTRWEYIYGEDETNEKKLEFGDYSARAIDENWYKSAVLQYQYDKSSFVYTVPFDVGYSDDIVVTASRAIFPTKIESPGAVAGFQFSHAHMQKRFFNITSELTNCRECIACGDLLDCYVVDSSGYIVVSHDRYDTGKFFGEVEGDVLEEMMNLGIYESVSVFDFQALCLNKTDEISSATAQRIQPFDFITHMMTTLLGKLAVIFLNLQDVLVWAEDFSTSDFFNGNETEEEILVEDDNEEDEDEEEEEPVYLPCDMERKLYLLNQTMTLPNEVIQDLYARTFYVRKVKSSNMILVAIHPSIKGDKNYTSASVVIKYENDTQHPCQKLSLNNLPRKRLQGCFNEHPLEQNITVCGRSTTIVSSTSVIFITLLIWLVIN